MATQQVCSVWDDLSHLLGSPFQGDFRVTASLTSLFPLGVRRAVGEAYRYLGVGEYIAGGGGPARCSLPGDFEIP
jgi:hypothetical protein